jgi:hypothetical protein
MLAGQLLMLGDEAPAMSDVQPTPAPGDLDGLPDEGEGHRVAIRLEAHEVILGDASRLAQAEAGLTRTPTPWNAERRDQQQAMASARCGVDVQRSLLVSITRATTINEVAWL